jgi:hypothetical protein
MSKLNPIHWMGLPPGRHNGSKAHFVETDGDKITLHNMKTLCGIKVPGESEAFSFHRNEKAPDGICKRCGNIKEKRNDQE